MTSQSLVGEDIKDFAKKLLLKLCCHKRDDWVKGVTKLPDIIYGRSHSSVI